MISITLESYDPNDPITACGHKFPANPEKEKPLRHTLNIGFFNEDDLSLIVDAIDYYLYSKEIEI